MKVALAGDGGDELFAGYNRYFEPPAVMAGGTWINRLGAALGVSAAGPGATRGYQKGMHPLLESEDLKHLLHEDIHAEIDEHQEWFLDQHYRPDLPSPKRWQALDFLTILPEQYLTKVDRASMANSLELRVPFLDKPLVELVFSLPVDAYTPGGERKYVLKKLMSGRLPERTITKRKRGFSIPLHHFFNENILLNFLMDGPGVKSGLIKKDYVIGLARQANGVSINRLWQILLFDAWYSRWAHSSCGDRA